MMVADMTAYMAKLVSILTQQAVIQANQLIARTDEANKKSETFIKIESIKLADADLVNFTSNLQLLDDESLEIPKVVEKVQFLAKKHVECLTLMHTFALNQLDNSLNLLAKNKEDAKRLQKIDDLRSVDCATLIQYAITELGATESHVKSMLQRISASVDKTKLVG